MWKYLIKSEKPSEAHCVYFSPYLDVWDKQREGAQVNFRFWNPDASEGGELQAGK